jgi:AraC-like DNA-binding protein
MSPGRLNFFDIFGRKHMSQPAEAHLAYLGFQLIQPSRPLRPYVRSIWYFRREAPLLTYHEEYMHPQGGFGIVFNFGDQLRLDRGILSEPVFLDGANTISRKMGFVGHIEVMGVAFYTGEAYPFLAVPLGELRNETALLDALDKPSLMQLYGRLYEADSLPARVNLLEQWLWGRLSLGKRRDLLIPETLALLRKAHGKLSVAQLAQKFAISQRQLERLYQSQVGMSPKQYAQLLRIETARLALKHMGGRSNASLAAELGFYDQAHFIREFRDVIGMTPYSYMQYSQKSKPSEVGNGEA